MLREGKKSFAQSLQKAEVMLETGLFSELIEFCHTLEPVDRNPGRQKVQFYTLQSNAFRYMGNYQKAYETGKIAVHLAQNIKNCLEVVDALLNLVDIEMFMERNTESLTLLDDFSLKIEQLENISEKERNRRIGISYLQRQVNHYYLGTPLETIDLLHKGVELLEIWGTEVDIAFCYSIFGIFHMLTGEFDQALHYFTKSQELCTKLDSPLANFFRMRNFLGMGVISWNRAEFQRAIEFTKKSEYWARKYNNPTFLMRSLHLLASIHNFNEEADLAIGKLKEALMIAEKLGGSLLIIDTLCYLCSAYLEIDDNEAADTILKEMEQSKHLNTKNKSIMGMYNYEKACLLSTSTRTRDLGEAQDILKSLIQNKTLIASGRAQVAILRLCLLLLDEFETSKDEEVLRELTPLLNELEDISSKERKFWMLADIYRLKAKVCLIYLDFTKSRQMFTQAQQIAEKYGLKDLAKAISNDHDHFLHILNEWEQLKQENSPMSTRLDKIHLYDQIQTMRRMKQIKFPDSTPESPILFLIMGESGVPVYTKIVDPEWKVNEELFSSFLSAFNSFSHEVFSQQLDRANFGKYTILITGISPFMTCYVFEGQSYSVQQKFSSFNEAFKQNEELWKFLTLSERIGRVIQPNSNPALEMLVDNLVKLKAA